MPSKITSRDRARLIRLISSGGRPARDPCSGGDDNTSISRRTRAADSRSGGELCPAARIATPMRSRRKSGSGDPPPDPHNRPDPHRGASEAGTDLEREEIDIALVADLREELKAVGRAEARIAAGKYGRSIDTGAQIPDERLEAAPLAERTIEEQRRLENGEG